ncbi:hypothetical protein [Marinospirillum sp.]|uniref:hypothetical protein n=1 Tax=Marinospirillum sp. TaxID=2183934 RepID=UPI00384F5C61
MAPTAGVNLHNSVKLIKQAGKEINALVAMIKNEINSAIEKDQLGCNAYTHGRGWSEESYLDDENYVCEFYSEVLPLQKTKRNRKEAQRYLIIQVSLDGEGMTHEEANNHEPLIHISLWDAPVDLNDGQYMSLLLEHFDGFSVQENVLLNWYPEVECWTEQSWTYSLILTSLNTPKDIQKKVINPIRNLMKTGDPLSARLDKLDGIVKYKLLREGVLQVL